MVPFVRVAPVAQASVLGGIVAKNGRFEVWAFRSRRGDPGRRRYVVHFEVVEVLTSEPRTIRDVELPETRLSNLKAIVAHLESRR